MIRYNATILAYGQTGSGKSFTMQEDPDHIGTTYKEDPDHIGTTYEEDPEHIGTTYKEDPDHIL